MKRIFFLTIVLAFFTNANSQSTTQLSVSEQQAFNLVIQKYDADKVDVFLLNDTTANASTQYYTYFIDEEPMKGWEHKCSIVTIPGLIKTGETIPLNIIDLRIPPIGNFEIRHKMPRNKTYQNHKPVVKSTPYDNSMQFVDSVSSKRTYAIILSGGLEPKYNYNRYWNDCSFIYQTLTKRYCIPKGNISIIMSDGKDPAPDMTINEESVSKPDSLICTLISQPLDLDGDGLDDIQYAATKENIQSVLQELLKNMNEDDHLFFFVIDHGGTDNYYLSSYIWLWNRDKLYDYELAEWLKPFIDKSITVNTVLGQCYAGGFVDDLDKIGCVTTMACRGYESSWACTDIPYDEFVYHWTSAINGQDAFGISVNADDDGDGIISMAEAFTFAQNKDRKNENPLFISTPTSLGETLAFNNIPYTNLCIRDNYDDDWAEPNLTTDVLWDSPDIWVRNTDDGDTGHQNPDYDPEEPVKTVYVRIHNNGTKDYVATETNDPKAKFIHPYWAKTATDMSARTWMGMEGYGRRPYVQPTGGRIDNPVYIPSIPAGECVTVEIPWKTTENMFKFPGEDNTDGHLFSVLAKIKNDGQPEEFSDTLCLDPKTSKRIAQKNTMILEPDGKNATKEAAAFVRNASDASVKHSIEIRDRTGITTPNDKSLFDVASVELTMSTKIFNAWQRGGSKTSGVGMPTEDAPQTFRFTSDNGAIHLINLNRNEFDKVFLKLNIHSRSNNQLGQRYVFDLIQRDEHDRIVGGTAFTYKEPAMLIWPITINALTADNGNVELQALMPEDGMWPEWSDQTDGVIGTGDRITVKPTRQNDTFTVSAMTSNGELAEGAISLEPTTGIKSVTQSLTEERLDIKLLSSTGSSDSEITVSAIEKAETRPLRQKIDANQEGMSIDASSLPSGLYVVVMTIDGTVVDSVKFNKM